MFNILLIDDEPRYSETLVDLASNFDLQIHRVPDLEAGILELENRFEEFDGVILDGRGLLNSDSEQEEDRHLLEAIRKLDALKARGKYIPAVVNTGFIDRYKSSFETDDLKIFSKNGEEEAMISHLKFLISGSADEMIRGKYPDAFAAFGAGYLPKAKESLLLGVLQAIDSQDLADLRTVFINPLRQLIEAFYTALNELDSDVLPNEYILDGNPNLFYCLRRVTGQEVTTKDRRGNVIKRYPRIDSVLPEYLGWLVTGIQNAAHKFSHDSNDAKATYALQSMAFGIMELLVWFKTFVDKSNHYE
jgi:hypothetical protein